MARPVIKFRNYVDVDKDTPSIDPSDLLNDPTPETPVSLTFIQQPPPDFKEGEYGLPVKFGGGPSPGYYHKNADKYHKRVDGQFAREMNQRSNNGGGHYGPVDGIAPMLQRGSSSGRGKGSKG